MSSVSSSASSPSPFRLVKSSAPLSLPRDAAHRILQSHQGTAVAPPAHMVAPSIAERSSARPWLVQAASGCEQPPLPKPTSSSGEPPALFTARSKPDSHSRLLLNESKEIPCLDDIIDKSECKPDPMYLYQSLTDRKYECTGSNPSPYCVIHRRSAVLRTRETARKKVTPFANVVIAPPKLVMTTQPKSSGIFLLASSSSLRPSTSPLQA